LKTLPPAATLRSSSSNAASNRSRPTAKASRLLRGTVPRRKASMISCLRKPNQTVAQLEQQVTVQFDCIRCLVPAQYVVPSTFSTSYPMRSALASRPGSRTGGNSSALAKATLVILPPRWSRALISFVNTSSAGTPRPPSRFCSSNTGQVSRRTPTSAPSRPVAGPLANDQLTNDE
jgi:hypothetical protein